MEKNWNSFSLKDHGGSTTHSSTSTTASADLFNVDDGRVKLREKSSKFVKVSQRGLRSRPFSCDLKNLNKAIQLNNDGSNSPYYRPEFVNGSRFTNVNLGDRHLNGSFQLLNTPADELRQHHTENSFGENGFKNLSEPLTLELYEKSPGPLRIYERRSIINNHQSLPSHRYPGPSVRKMHNYPNDYAQHVLRSSSNLDLQHSEGSCILENNMKSDNYNDDVGRDAANVYMLKKNVKPYPEGMGSLSDAAKNGLLPRREYGSASSIDQLLAKQDQPRQNTKQHSCVDHSRFSKIISSTSTSAAKSSSSSVQKQISSGPEHFRASLRREKAIDLPNYSSNEPAASVNGGRPISASTTPGGNAKDKESKSVKKEKVKTSRTKSGNESILKKLIGVGLKTHSADLPDNMSSTPVGCRDFIKPEFSSDSLELKCEDKIRRKIFAHFDCSSISVDVTSLLNGGSKLKESNFSLNSATGASQASRPKVSTTGGVDSLISPINEDPNTIASDTGDGKSSALLLSCPFFRNELGGEPWKTVYLSRDIPSSATAGTSTTTREDLETWLRVPTASEASVIENLSNVYLGGRLCAKRQDNLVVEHIDQGAFFYRHCFAGKVHQNYFGVDDNLGPVAISIIRDKIETIDFRKLGLNSPNLYRIIVRLSDLSTFRGAILEDSLPSHQTTKDLQPSGSLQSSGVGTGSVVSHSKYPVKELIELTIPDLQLSSLHLALPVPRTEEMLLKLDEQGVYTRFKVGILYCRANQNSEEQMYNNEVAGPAFEEFLDMLGQRVRLKGFDKYKGGLDNRGDSTGQYSIYTAHQQYEIMFHVSTMLPFTPSNKQQLSRKRHIGNDIVTVVFQEPGAMPFSPQTVRSHFQHVFVVIQAHNPNTDNVHYSVAVSRCKDVPAFGPAIPADAIFTKSNDFREILLTKIINAENAVHTSQKFATMAARTRREFMRDLADNHVTSHCLESSTGKIGKILGSSTKRKDRPKPKLILDSFVRGAIVWDVQVLAMVDDFDLCKSVECHLGISADYLVLIEKSRSKDVIFCTPTHSVIGWTSHGNSLKLYYDHAEVVILRTLDDEECTEMQEILKRLLAVTKGCETVEMMLRRNTSGQLGFNIQQEGIVSDVEMYNSAWQAGLRQGARLVEICKVSIAALTYNRMLELLRNTVAIKVLVIPPLEDGSPRRGCEDPYCPAVLSDDSAFTTFLPEHAVIPAHLPGRLPPSYETAMLRKQLVINPAVIDSRLLEIQSPEARLDNGYESGSNAFSKSLEDIQGRVKWGSDDLRSTSADQGFYGPANPDYPSNTISSLSSDEQWRWSSAGSETVNPRPSVRTDTLSSSGSTASSEMSTDSGKRIINRTCELKRKVDKANSDIIQRLSIGDANNYKICPPLPPKSYKHKTQTTPHSSHSHGQLTVPSHRQIAHSNSSSVQESLLRLINNVDSDNKQSKNQQCVRPTSFIAERNESPTDNWNQILNDSTISSDIANFVKSKSLNCSPEMNNYHLKYEAAQQKIKYLEEKVDRLQLDLEKERESKCKLDYEMISLKDSNKRLVEECRETQLELKKFTDWFFNAVERGSESKIDLNGGSPHYEQ